MRRGAVVRQYVILMRGSIGFVLCADPIALCTVTLSRAILLRVTPLKATLPSRVILLKDILPRAILLNSNPSTLSNSRSAAVVVVVARDVSALAWQLCAAASSAKRDVKHALTASSAARCARPDDKRPS
ncbi:hypothetical protein N7495_004891 [Penicillium taxi]|uniref:uncharacterized protein n=1 Tax=Penicillium taxi TaxID=168475 RepID=UPI0025456539|nr:uncharacterized protein N7495_004891 [Penicillium taxi]KAJ5900147.1 hypothetical protein N7495_004891 [Penicillium taxi]